MNIADILRTHAHRIADVPALRETDATLSYRDLDLAVDAACLRLRAHGVTAGDVLIVCLREGLLHVVLWLAAMRLGAACCIMDWRSRPAERQALSATLAPRLTLVEPGDAAVPAGRVLSVDRRWLEPSTARPERIASDADGAAPAILLLSSGTTGQPKATVISHRAAAWRGMIRVANFRLQSGTRALSAMPLSTSAALSSLLGQLVAGATTLFHRTMYSPEELVETLRRERIQHVAIVPTVLRWMMSLPPAPAGGLLPDVASLLVLGAAFHPEEKAAAMARISPNLYENYGSAGTGTICAATPADLAAAPGSVGRPSLFTHVEVVDADGRALPPGEPGRVRVRSPSAASGYFADGGRDEVNEVFRDGWVFPGDIGRFDADGRLYLEGRAINLILRGGQNIYPEEIERVLQEHPAVVEAAVVGRNDRLLGQVPVALVVTRNAVSTAALVAHCRANLLPAKVPQQFHMLDSLPKTAAGKLHRAALAALLGDAPQTAAPDDGP